nr:Chain T, HLJ1_G0054350.mRNA.1.CDS.1 [Saccharomyces cerevisiae]
IVNRYEKLLSQRPEWHAPWKLSRVINGHLGWVRCVAIDPVDNEWFITGSNDTTMKVWDLATGKLKTTLAGHVMTVRDVAVSDRHPYLFSVSEDKTVKCWDLEKNQIIRDYYGHLSGVRTVSIHPTLDLIATAGRDSVIKLWDMRTRIPVITLVGHKGPINQVQCTPVDPQVVSSSTDATVRLWDVVAGKTMKVLTHHKRSVRATALHPKEFSVASACTDDIRSWGLAEGSLLTNFESEKTGIINTLSINQDDVLFAGGDNGVLSFYDYKSGHKYQSLATREMVGSLEGERSVLCSTFDKTGLRLITGEADKSIKIWKQDETATKESEPGLAWNPNLS